MCGDKATQLTAVGVGHPTKGTMEIWNSRRIPWGLL